MKSSFVLPLLFLGVTGPASMVLAQSPGTFTAAGNLTTQRMDGHTATLLTNGRVLIAGGFAVLTGWPVWTSAELYDPSTRTFTATGSMTAPRFQHTATLLPNGKVLIAGGHFEVTPNTPLASAELYDPGTGTFTAAGIMTATRQGHTATLLNNGKVLIAGGYSDRILLSKAELYDPLTGNFTPTGDMTTGHAWNTAALLANGKVLIAGFQEQDAELYDPDTGTFSVARRTIYPDMYPQTVSLLTNGKALVTLGWECGDSDLAEVYDPSAGIFTATGSMTKPKLEGATATPLPDGKVLIAGREWVQEYRGIAELYDPATGKFTATSGMITHHEAGFTSTLLPDGTVLLSGGRVCCGASPDTAEIYYPAVLVPSPVLFSLSQDGRGQGAILHSGTHQIVSPANPAVAGEALEIYLTGLTSGSLIPPQVAIGGRMAPVLFFGNTPGFVGLNQVNVRVPNNVTPGPAVPVRLTYLSRPSNEVSIGVQ